MKTRMIETIAVFLFVAAAMGMAADAEKGAATMTLNGGNTGNVPFPHQKHQESLKNCALCHDMVPQKAGAVDQLKADGKLKGKEVMNKLCVKCHREKSREGVPSGPLTCKDCHIKG